MFNVNKSPFGGPNNTPSFFTSTPARFGENFPKPTSPNFGEFNKIMPPNFGSSAPFATSTNSSPQVFGQNPFGSNNQMLFGQTSEIFANQFGQPDKFNFTPKTTGFMFGQQQSNVFKAQSNTGIFPSASFCAPSVPPGTVVKFAPVKLTDTAIIKGMNQTINGRNQCITCMKEYEDKSLEELRWEDYQVNRKGPQDNFFTNNEPMSMESPATTTVNIFPSMEDNSKNIFGYKFGNCTTSSNTPLGLFGKPVFGFGNANTKTQCTPSNNYFGNQPQQQQQSIFNQTTNIFSINRNTPFKNTTTSNLQVPQNNQTTLFPGLNTNTTFSFGNSPVVTSTAVIGQSTFGQNNLFNTFKPSINPQPNIFANNATTSYKSAFPSLTNHQNVFKFNPSTPPQNVGNHQTQQLPQLQSTNQFSFPSNQNQNYHEQILSMSSNPYGLSDLLHNIKEIDNSIKDSTRATNPNELNTLLKTVKPEMKINEISAKLQPVHIFRKADQSMFDGLEANVECQAQRNPKKLFLRKYTFVDVNNEEVVCSDLNGIFEHMNKTCSNSPLETIESVASLEPVKSVEALDEEKIEHISTSTQVEDHIMQMQPQHPTGIILTRPEYYTVPPLEDLVDFINEDNGSCIVQGFTVGRLGYGNVYFPEAFDVSNLNLDELVHFCYKEVTIYPDDEKKPPKGEGLNRKAQITLDKVWPYDKKTNMLITDVDLLTEMDYADRLRRLCDRQQTKFVDYRPDTGSWVFRVDHFSKYGDQDDDDSLDDSLDDETKEDFLNLNNDFSRCALMKSTFFDDLSDSNLNEINDDNVLLNDSVLLEDDLVTLTEQNHLDLPFMVPLKKSYINYFKVYSDVAGFKSRSYKIGWANNLQFLALKYPNNILKNSIEINQINAWDTTILHQCLEQHLTKQLDNSTYHFNNSRNVPNFSSTPGFKLLQDQLNVTCCQNTIEGDIWRLCNALWGQIHSIEVFDERNIRKKLLTTWLQSTIEKETLFKLNDSSYKTIMKYLCLNDIETASQFALQQNNFNLSLLISQLPANTLMRSYLMSQLNIWKDMTDLIDRDLLQIYLVMAGQLELDCPRNKTICIYEHLNWLQVIGLFLWFVINPEETISRGVNLYEYYFTRNNAIVAPFIGDRETYDLRYQLLKYYSDNKYPIGKLLDPLTHTVNILDYRLSWFLLQILESLKCSEINPKMKTFVHLNFAGQLEAMQQWHWAVFVLLFLDDCHLKAHAIQDVIGRNVEISDCSVEYRKREQFLIHTLMVPAKWLETAKATLAKSLGQTQLAICYLCYAEQWHEAYALLMDLLLPNNYFSYDYEFLNKILTPLSFHKNLLPNWDEGGGLILDFARLGIECNTSARTDNNNGRMFRNESIRFRSSVVNIHARLRDITDLSYMRHICAAGIAGRSWSVLDHLFN